MPEDIKALIHGSVASTHARFDKLFTIKSIELIVDEIHRCKRVIIWGYGICFMESMPEMNLFMDGKNCIFCMSTPEQRQTDTDLREGDLAIVLLPDAIANMRDTQSCLQSAKEHNAEFTAITSCEAELFALCAAYLVSDPGARNMIDRYCLQYTLAYNSIGKNIKTRQTLPMPTAKEKSEDRNNRFFLFIIIAQDFFC